jgi:hypothetical protein
MKRLFVVATMFAALSLPALAAKNSGSMSVPEPVKAGSTKLIPGNYDLTWTGTGADVQVTVTQNKKVIATFPAKLVEEANKNVGLETESQGGVDVLHSIRLRNTTLTLASSPSSGQ